MAEAKDLIVSKLTPKIPLRELWSADESKISSDNIFYKGTSGAPDPADSIGANTPYVMINQVPITKIDYLVIDETSTVPKLKIIFRDETGAMSTLGYPKNNPILSLYIKPQNPNLKPIRCDYLILSIATNSDPAIDDPIDGVTYILSGELYIPKLYENVSKCYANLTSSEALMRLADDLDLGFAKNEFTTNDAMSWINVNKNNGWFMNNIARHAYLDDDSFFTYFIDRNYHLTFINVAEQLNPNAAPIKTFFNTNDGNIFDSTRSLKDASDDQSAYDQVENIKLSNIEGLKGSPYYITNYKLSGDVGRILKNKGYKKKIYYYDHTIDGDKFVSFFMKPIEIKGYNNREDIALSPDDEVLKESVVKKWMNIDYGNTHREWNASVLINDHNNSELNKTKLKVETSGFNFQITRGMGVPVTILTQSIKQKEQFATRTDVSVIDDYQDDLTKGASLMIRDEVISGKYVVSGIKYIYDPLDIERPIKTEFHLGKMNWIGEKKYYPDAT